MFNKDRMNKRVPMCILGVVLCAIGVGMFNVASFGVDPFQCFAQGSYRPFSSITSYGFFYIIFSAAMLIFDWFFARRLMGLATLICMFGIGYIVEFTVKLLGLLWPVPSLAVRVTLLLVGIVVLCFSSALYYTADLGVSVYDAIPLSLAERRIKVFGHIAPFKYIRIFCDVVCVAIGMLFGLMPGIGTLITAFFMGPLVDLLNRKVAVPMLYGRDAQSAR